MKYTNYFLIAILLIASSSCKKSLDDEFEEANGEVSEKLISRIVVSSNHDEDQNGTYLFNYDGDNRISSLSDGESNSFFTYDSNDKLTKISSANDPIVMDDLYQTPYDLFEDGNVTAYDDNGNPEKVEVYEEDYYEGEYILYGTITYDPNPNPLYYTMKAGGIIDVLDRINFDIGTPTSPTLVKAKKMLPFNNFKSMIFRNVDGEIETDIQFKTYYDDDGYAELVTITSLNEDGTSVSTIQYFY
jgi:hypothetical protein